MGLLPGVKRSWEPLMHRSYLGHVDFVWLLGLRQPWAQSALLAQMLALYTSLCYM